MSCGSGIGVVVERDVVTGFKDCVSDAGEVDFVTTWLTFEVGLGVVRSVVANCDIEVTVGTGEVVR